MWLVRRPKRGIFAVALVLLLGILVLPLIVKLRARRSASHISASRPSDAAEPLVVTAIVSAQPLFNLGGDRDGPPLPSIPFKVPEAIDKRICELGGFQNSPFGSIIMGFISNSKGTVELRATGLSGADLQGTGMLKAVHVGYKLEPVIRIDEPRTNGRHLMGLVRVIQFDGNHPRNFDVDFDMVVHLRKGSVWNVPFDPTSAEIRWSFQP